ncbi:odorant receptor 43a [Stomoxys calcitrans]|uniref:odorant receptor 43a n=1 Tax=Stomoxys calcitrans TaxID=35570 RepID=UPI0027E34785|nr:odorant receptor 43a [Stomoxys calcitrans]
MLRDNPMLSINVKLWQYLAVVFPGRGNIWRLYAFVLPVCVMNAMQFVYLFRMWGDLAPFILNTFFAAAIFDALLRTCLVILNRDKFEALMLELALLYNEIEQSNDVYAKRKLKEATAAARKVSIFNLTASFCDIVGALIYPLLCEGRVHPFGVALPGVDMTASPIYEIFYVLQFSTPLALTIMYMPFVSLFASFAMFGKTALMILQHRLQNIWLEEGDENKFAALRRCIKYYDRLTRYVYNFNSMVTYIVCVEFLLFGAIICSLLFCMNIIETFTQIISIIMYILTMMYVLFTYYWHANEMLMESVKVSEAAYAIPWYYGNHEFRKTLLLFIIRTQKPLQIMVGNVYPMTLATFQSLLNTSYTYFTMLRGLYNQ